MFSLKKVVKLLWGLLEKRRHLGAVEINGELRRDRVAEAGVVVSDDYVSVRSNSEFLVVGIDADKRESHAAGANMSISALERLLRAFGNGADDSGFVRILSAVGGPIHGGGIIANEDAEIGNVDGLILEGLAGQKRALGRLRAKRENRPVDIGAPGV